jgi:hypothetical protein
MLHYITIKQVDTPVHKCDIGVPLLYKAWLRRDSLFDFRVFVRVPKPDFPRIFLLVPSCSNIKPFEVRESTAWASRNAVGQSGCVWICALDGFYSYCVLNILCHRPVPNEYFHSNSKNWGPSVGRMKRNGDIFRNVFNDPGLVPLTYGNRLLNWNCMERI